jgi:hypothetical protein
MPLSAFRGSPSRAFQIFCCHFLARLRAVCQAASIRGVVTDASGAKVTGANVVLLSNGKVVASPPSRRPMAAFRF